MTHRRAAARLRSAATVAGLCAAFAGAGACRAEALRLRLAHGRDANYYYRAKETTGAKA